MEVGQQVRGMTVRSMYPAKPGRTQAAANPRPRAARQTFEGQPRSTRRGVSSFPREPSGDEATAAVETRAVDKWLPRLKLLDYEWDKDTDSDVISFSGGDLVVYKRYRGGHEYLNSSYGVKSSGAKSLMLGRCRSLATRWLFIDSGNVRVQAD